MNTQIIDIAQRAIYMAAILIIPILLVCLIVGVIISIFQSATQIHEQTLTFVPKVIAVLILLAVAGGWFVSQLESFTREVFTLITQL